MFTLYFTAFILSGEYIAIRAILRYLQLRRLRERAAAKEINVKDTESFNMLLAQMFRRLKEGDLSFKDKSRLGTPSVVSNETLSEIEETTVKYKHQYIVGRIWSYPSVDTSINSVVGTDVVKKVFMNWPITRLNNA